MDELQFELDGEVFTQVAFPLEPSTAEAVPLPSAWQKSADGAFGIFARFENIAGRGMRRWLGAVGSGQQGGGLANWKARVKERLAGAGAAGSGSFHDALPARLFPLRTDDYSVSGAPVFCDFSLTSLVESFAQSDELRETPFAIQFNFQRKPWDREERRFYKKQLVALEGVLPDRLYKKQQAFVEEAIKYEWRVLELLAAADEDAFRKVRREVDRAFRESTGREGFDDLLWADDEGIGEIAWRTGICFDEEDCGARSMVSEQVIKAVWDAHVSRIEPASIRALPAAERGGRDVFISYSTRDYEAAVKTCSYLEDNGVTCWIAPRNIQPGSEWADEIVAGIASSKLTVILVSEGSNISRYVLRELEITVSEGHPVLPIRIKECQLRGSVKFFLASQQWLDATTSPLSDVLPELLAVIRKLSVRD